MYRIVAGVAGLVVICFVLLWMFDYLIYNVIHISQKGMPSFLTKFALGMAANVPILLVFELIYYLRSEQKAIADSEKSKRKALLYQHETLRAQINPHFLFNSLNVLSSLIYINQDNANRFTKALSKTYRYVLSLNQHPMISVAEELEALNSYIFMMTMRFQNSFTFVIKKMTDREDNMIIPLTLQLLIENAFKHNLATEALPLDIQIIVDNDYIIVKNNLQPSNNVDNNGIGLKYLTEQYQLYSKAVVVEFGSHTFVVKVPYIE